MRFLNQLIIYLIKKMSFGNFDIERNDYDDDNDFDVANFTGDVSKSNLGEHLLVNSKKTMVDNNSANNSAIKSSNFVNLDDDDDDIQINRERERSFNKTPESLNQISDNDMMNNSPKININKSPAFNRSPGFNRSPNFNSSPNLNHFDNSNNNNYNRGGSDNDEDYLSPEEEMNRKKDLLHKFERLEKKGLTCKKFTLNSSYKEMKWEYERIKDARDTENSIKFYRKGMIAVTNIIEILNSKFDPFDLRLDGWSESIYDDIDEYDDVFEELHDKYKGKVKVAPEIRLLMMLGGSGFMYHFQQAAFKNSSLPNAEEILKSDPNLMKQFNQAAKNKAAESSNPMMSMMGNILGGGGGGGAGGLGGLMSGLMGGLGGNNGMANPGMNSGNNTSMTPPDININDLMNNNNMNDNDDIRSVSMTEIDNDDRISEVISLSGLDLDDDIDEQSNKFEKPNMATWY